MIPLGILPFLMGSLTSSWSLTLGKLYYCTLQRVTLAVSSGRIKHKLDPLRCSLTIDKTWIYAEKYSPFYAPPRKV